MVDAGVVNGEGEIGKLKQKRNGEKNWKLLC